MSSPPRPSQLATLVELLRWRAERQPDERVYTFLLDGEAEEAHLTFAEFDAAARALAATLQEIGAEGERALMLYPPGLDYVVGFFGCLYARTTAVPAYPPRLGRPNPRLAAIVGDARPAVVLTPDFIRVHESSVVAQNPELAGLKWLAPDADVVLGAESAWRPPGMGHDTLAFLQYTSGSTASPKGVMVSHGDLLTNLGAAHKAFDYSSETVGVVWLPPYHDMGLIGGVLHPMYGGFRMVLMSPIAFLQRPARWLEAISRHRGTATGGPTSAYGLCADRVSEEEREGLDLSALQRAMNGAEPVRADVLDRFAAAFAPCGFRREAFYPCYGLAEATLVVAGGRDDPEPVVWPVDSSTLQDGRAVDAMPDDERPYELVGCGHPAPGMDVVIADPETGQRRPPGEVGEIWVAGPGVARGYWDRPEESARTFGAHLADDAGPYLRTGDLGVIRDGTLFVTGRLSDVIIVGGRNHYPQDVEATVERCHPALDPNRGAAFSVEVDEGERLVVVHELPRDTDGLDLEAVVGAVRQAVAEEHELQAYAVALIRSRTIPRTSSGKIQRRPCRQRFLAGTLELVHEWRAGAGAAGPTAPSPAPVAAPGSASPPASAGERAIQRWLQSEIAQRLGLDVDAVDVTQPFTFFGLDSVQAVTIAGDLGRWLSRPVAPTIAWDHPTIQAAARFLTAVDERLGGRPARQRRDAEPSEPIAVVGMACRFPGGADDPDKLWSLLREGGDGVRGVPPDRWDSDALYDPDPDAPGRTYSRHGGFIDNVAGFDAGFFGVSPREASYMDPQQRLLLEVSWEALERAAIAPDALAGTGTGAFVGISTTDYALLQAAQGGATDVYAGTGSAHSIAANRLSYLLGLEGPSLAVDTACSSSLAAAHLACTSLRSGECDLALAGGVNLLLAPEPMVSFAKARMLSPTGRCRAFADDADGYVRGEGCGVIVLKRLSDAETAGDRVLAVIRGSAMNQDGRSNGLTAPHGPSQEDVICRALDAAGVAPAEVDYVEAHGTGTPLGDPIELRALGEALGPKRERPLLLGSVKTNIGHLEAAAGIAGLIKAVLVVGHGEVPPHLHLAEPNRHVAWDELPLRVATDRIPMPDGPRIAGVSSFGFGGTNVHLVLQASPDAAPGPSLPAPDRPALVKLAAHGEPALAACAARLRDFVGRNPELGVPAVARTANVGRADLPDRAAVVATTRDQLAAGLEAIAAGSAAAGTARGRKPAGGPPRVAFLVAGQGNRYGGALAGLHAHDAAVRRRVDTLAEVLGPADELPLAALLEPGDDSSRALAQTEIAQPALYALALALAAWWHNAGVQPAAVVGHSVGAYAAAALAGVVSPEDGARLVAARGRLMAGLAGGGAMAAVASDAETVGAALAAYPELAIACLNARDETVVAGPRAPLERLCEELDEAGARARILEVSHAFHSPLVEPCLPALEDELRRVELRPPRISFVSDTTGADAGAEVATPGYWVRHARRPVDFAAALATLGTAGHSRFVELGPASTLLGLARRNPATREATPLPTLDPRNRSDQPLRSLARAWATGTPVDWRSVSPPVVAAAELPTYSFQRERYWLPERRRGRSPARAGLVLQRVATPLPQDVFETDVGVQAAPLLGDHRVFGRPIVAGAVQLDLILAAASQAGMDNPGARDLALLTPLAVPDEGERRVQVVLEEPGGGRRGARLYSQADVDGTWELHAQATVGSETLAFDPCPANGYFPDAVETDDWYREVREHGLDFGRSFQAIESLRCGEGCALAGLRLPPEVAPAGSGRLHPVLIDAGFQTLGALLADSAADEVFVPAAIERFVPSGADAQAAVCRAVLRDDAGSGGVAAGDVQLLDDSGRPVAELHGVRLVRATAAALRGPVVAPDVDTWLYKVDWRERGRERDPGAGGPGTWLIAGNGRGAAADLAQRLTAAGAETVIVDAGDLAELGRAVSEALEAHGPIAGAVYLGCDSAPPDSGAEPAAIDSGAARALTMIQALTAQAHEHSPRMYLVTRGAQPADGDVRAPAQAPLWGLGRVAAQEHPFLRSTSIDLDPDAPDDIATLAAELLAGDAEAEVAFRGARRLVSRLARCSLPPAEPSDDADGRGVSLSITRKGVLEDLALHPASVPAPGPGQVKIRVRAAALNFRDVLNALGLYPGDAGPLGGECAGDVVAVGDGVTSVTVGDEVVAIAPASFSTYALTDVRLTAPKPSGLTFEQGSAIPIAFLTARYGLERLGGLAKGQRVLIHAGTGGVGLAAVQLCRRAGAEVFATAGSPRKRDHLESLGVRHAMDSRSLAFADQVLAATGGDGVDIVLNSLAGEALLKSLSVLKPGGRFIEIGKADILDPDRVAALEREVDYHAFDLAELCGTRPEMVHAALLESCSELEVGWLEPLPTRVFDFDQASMAFRHMSQAKHIGKVVLAAPEPDPRPSGPLRPDATYLVTGGLGALGRRVARWLADNGARSIVLAGRSAPDGDGASRLGDDSPPPGVTVVTRRCDVSRENDLAALLEGIGPSLRGIVHAAGVLDDGVIAQQTAERFAAVGSPKAHGALHLHRLTCDRELDFLVFFSSAAAVLGSPGQANYAAASAFLDALALHRRGQGLPATSLDWGPWEEVGMTSGTDAADRRWRARGIDAIPIQRGLELLGRALRDAPPQIAVLPVDWRALSAATPAGAAPPLLEDFVSAAGPGAAAVDSAPAPELVAELHATPPEKRVDALVERISHQAAMVLGLDPRAGIDADRPLAELGLDSLTGVELGNVVGRMVGMHLPATLLFDYPSLRELAGYILDALVPENPADVAADSEDERARAISVIEQLSEDEAAGLVNRSVAAVMTTGEE